MHNSLKNRTTDKCNNMAESQNIMLKGTQTQNNTYHMTAFI